MIKRTPGSTSRIDMGTVQLSHGLMPGASIKFLVVAAFGPRFSYASVRPGTLTSLAHSSARSFSSR